MPGTAWSCVEFERRVVVGAAVAGGSVTINQFEVFPFINAATGRMRIGDANSMLLIGGNWSNAGTITLNLGTLALDGTFTRAGIGVVAMLACANRGRRISTGRWS